MSVPVVTGNSPKLASNDQGLGVPPRVTMIYPAIGTLIRIVGTGFFPGEWVGIAVLFDAVPTKFIIISETEIIAVSPPGTGCVYVQVSNLGVGASSFAPFTRFTYPAF